MRGDAWLLFRFAGCAVQADDLPFAVRPFEDARRDAGAFDRLAIREDDRVVIGFGSDRDLAFAAHRDLIVLEGKGLERLQLGREMMIAIMREIRSEEHTSELQSLMRNSYAVFCLKKKNTRMNSSH